MAASISQKKLAPYRGMLMEPITEAVCVFSLNGNNLLMLLRALRSGAQNKRVLVFMWINSWSVSTRRATVTTSFLRDLKVMTYPHFMLMRERCKNISIDNFHYLTHVLYTLCLFIFMLALHDMTHAPSKQMATRSPISAVEMSS